MIKVQKAIEDNEKLMAEREELELPSTSKILIEVMQWRKKELDAFRYEKKLLKEFIAMCSDIHGG